MKFFKNKIFEPIRCEWFGGCPNPTGSDQRDFENVHGKFQSMTAFSAPLVEVQPVEGLTM